MIKWSIEILKKDRETLKTLNFRQKVRFIFDYYKGQMFILFACLLFLYYVGDLIHQSSQVIDLGTDLSMTARIYFPPKS